MSLISFYPSRDSIMGELAPQAVLAFPSPKLLSIDVCLAESESAQGHLSFETCRDVDSSIHNFLFTLTLVTTR